MVSPTQVLTVLRESPVAIDQLPEVTCQPSCFPSIKPGSHANVPIKALGEQEDAQETEPELIGDPTGTLVAQPTQTESLKVRLKVSINAPLRQSNRIRANTPDYTGLNGRTAYLACKSALILSITPTSGEPKSIAEALKPPDAHKWTKAINTELGTLQAKGTWVEVPEIPEGRKFIGCKWVFKTKTNANDNVIKYKACLVVQGLSQQPGVN